MAKGKTGTAKTRAVGTGTVGAKAHSKKTAPRDAKSGTFDKGGVVAYTKGSRLRDADVQAAVQRVLGKS